MQLNISPRSRFCDADLEVSNVGNRTIGLEWVSA